MGFKTRIKFNYTIEDKLESHFLKEIKFREHKCKVLQFFLFISLFDFIIEDKLMCPFEERIFGEYKNWVLSFFFFSFFIAYLCLIVLMKFLGQG